jgi:copper chaperone CopZ
MESLKFKTSLKCNGCINAIKPGLEKLEGIESWTVDLASPDKTLTVVAERSSTEDIINAVKKAGYHISLA